MAYTNNQTTAQVLAAIQSANANAATDAVLNALGTLLWYQAPSLLWGVLVKCTNPSTGIYSYDANPS